MRRVTLALVILSACDNASAPSTDGSGGAAATSTSSITQSGSTDAGAGGDGGGRPRCSVDDGTPEHMIGISVGAKTSMALSSHGRVACWGEILYGECGRRAAQYIAFQPKWVQDLPCIKQVDLDANAFALTDDGSVLAWGTEFEAELGDGEGTEGPFGAPVTVLLDVPASSVGSTRAGAKAMTEAGAVLWGTVGFSDVFHEPILWELPAGSQVFASGGQVYEVDATGKARARGYNERGHLGDGTAVNRFDFVDVLTDARFAEIRPALTFVCGITVERGVYCWGENYLAALGIGVVPEPDTPPAQSIVRTPTQLEGLANIVDIDLAEAGGCAIDEQGVVYCWGSNRGLRFRNDEELEPVAAPRVVEDLSPARSVAVGDDHVCVQRPDDSVWCRGRAILRGFFGDAPTVEATEMQFPFEDE